MAMPKTSPILLTIVFFHFFMTIITQHCSARTLDVPSSSHHHHHHHEHSSLTSPTITFFMQDMLNGTRGLSKPATAKVNHQLPFSKPLGLFPPNGGIPLVEPNPTIPVTSLNTHTLDLSTIGLSFPARATLQELEFGTITVIDEDIFEGSMIGSIMLGKAQGIYVASSEDGRSHMMAITVVFSNGEFKDSLRFFGVLRMIDMAESHIAMIGGTGKYQSANGYAIVKAVNVDSKNNFGNGSEGAIKLLRFNVHL